MDTGTLNKLIARVQQGDQEAFSQVYDEFAERIYKFISFKISDREQAEDLLQEVFVKVWHGCPKLKLEDLNFTAWLYTVAGNTVKDHYRKVYRRPQTVSLDPAMDITASEDSSRLASSALDRTAVQAALEMLPDNYKQVLELRFIQEFSIEETAKAMQKNSVSVRVLQHRAIKKLETIFKNYQ
jgi:RNA polymerase sigma-70 factor (ECF subfamily)